MLMSRYFDNCNVNNKFKLSDCCTLKKLKILKAKIAALVIN